MYVITKRIEIAGAHQLDIPYDSPCTNLHGHNWIITMEVSSEEVNQYGMVVDFARISSEIKQLDHRYLNDFLDNPTAENIAKFFCNSLQKILNDMYQKGEVHRTAYVSKVTVQESEGNIVCYTP